MSPPTKESALRDIAASERDICNLETIIEAMHSLKLDDCGDRVLLGADLLRYSEYLRRSQQSLAQINEWLRLLELNEK